MEEAFRREKEEKDRLFREQKSQYESQIVQLQKQMMESSMSQSMISSVLSSSGLIESISVRTPTLHENQTEIESERFDSSWSNESQRRALWVWRKWRRYQMTSLRVRFVEM